MENHNCSLLVLSCDKNSSLLKIFFDFINDNWPDCPFPKYLGIENSNILFDGVKTLKSDEKRWAARVMEYLHIIPSQYIMVVLDDFLPEQVVDTRGILHYLSLIKNDNRIATISLADIYDKKNIKLGHDGLVQRKRNADYLLNLQVGIWDKDVLLTLMRKEESPWQTELFGSIRARKLKNRRFLCLESDEKAPYRYNRGWLMVRGAWNGNEIRRLRLERYSNELFDGRDILYKNLMYISLGTRINRRIQIEYRKMLSWVGIYL